MSLRTYKKKRLFNKTPEPSGKKQKRGTKKVFVIHKHAASHLHYDLRLEMQGVLKSWAVPKGPSMNSQDKRLAIQVEDHPYDYKDFEGVIPKGNYGAGKVIIWDEGEYELMTPSALLNKESFKFILHGKKLKGTFSLIKMKNTINHWLLIKVTDEFSSTKNILKNARSVRSKKVI
jgi:bifunctional non-homologous end joining protein LigD